MGFNFRKIFTEVMAEKGLSDSTVAEQMGIHINELMRYFDRRTLDTRTLSLLSVVLGVNVFSLLAKESENDSHIISSEEFLAHMMLPVEEPVSITQSIRSHFAKPIVEWEAEKWDAKEAMKEARSRFEYADKQLREMRGDRHDTMIDALTEDL